MPIKEINAPDLRDLIRTKRDKLEIIDVREPEEYAELHIKGSKLIPMSEISRRFSEIDWSKEVVFVCRSGSRSRLAASIATLSGREVNNLENGIFECQADGKGEFLEYMRDSVEGDF